MAGWAILGTGAVSARFAAGLESLGSATRIVTVASREDANAVAFAARHGGTVTDYAGAVERSGVDAVYVATPPSLHESHALLAIAAGKAVLLEKPFAPDAAAASRIVEAARSAGVFCMEAMWTRFMPMVAEVQARAASGVLGDLRTLSASFLYLTELPLAIQAAGPDGARHRMDTTFVPPCLPAAARDATIDYRRFARAGAVDRLSERVLTRMHSH